MTATITQFKTKNQIYKDFKSYVETALSAFAITGWEVKKLHQIIKTEDLTPCIYIQIISKKQHGAQYRNQETINEGTIITYNKNFFGFFGSELQPANQDPFTDGSPVKTETTIYKRFKKYFVKEEIQIRFSATRREIIQDTVETLNGTDVLEHILNYFQSLDGINMLKTNGYAQFRATAVNEQSFANDSENIQLMPYFDCNYIYTDIWQNEIQKVDKVKQHIIKGV